MKIKLTLIIAILLGTFAFAQNKVEVDNGIFVTFPTTPKYTANTKARTYVAKTNNCIFMTIILNNQIPNYDKYVIAKQKWSSSEIKEMEDLLLDNAVKGKLEYTDSNGIVKKIKIGKYNGRKIEYSAINPVTGKRSKRFSILLLVRDKVISFECWYMNNSTNAKLEKDMFFNSINAK